jgi:hypothetical protein
MSTKRGPRGFWRAFVYLLLVGAILPFLLRLGLDLDGVNRQALKKIYQQWKWAEVKTHFAGVDTVVFKRSDRRDRFEEFFISELQKEFKVVEVGNFPELRAFFEKDRSLRARIEWRMSPSDPKWEDWEGEARFPNNGILIGFWVALIFFFFGRSPKFIISIAIFLMLAWASRWNLLAIPWIVLEPVYQSFKELHWRILQKDWSGWDFGSLPFFASILWFLLSSFFQGRIFRRFLTTEQRNWAILGASVVVEPIAIFLGSRLVPWSQDASWWKVYVGSFGFRFVTFSYLFSIVIRHPSRPHAPENRRSRYEKLALLLVPTFLISGGWAWLHAVLIVEEAGSALLHLKVFVTSAVLAALLGSRIFSVFFGLIVLCFVATPTHGHYDAAATFGFFMDGLLIGWWLTPLKGEFPILPFPERKQEFLLSSFVGWTLGVFLWAAGVPISICWIAVLLAIWSYGQMRHRGNRPLVESEA